MMRAAADAAVLLLKQQNILIFTSITNESVL